VHGRGTLVVGFALLVGAAAAAPPPTVGCEHLFEPPAGAELLCDEHVMARAMEIHWRSYAVAEERVAVNQRYRARAASCAVAIVTKPPLFSISQGNRRLETYEAGASGPPTCAKAPGPGARTLVIISEKLDRKP
jgi:hypothetical protein